MNSVEAQRAQALNAVLAVVKIAVEAGQGRKAQAALDKTLDLSVLSSALSALGYSVAVETTANFAVYQVTW